MQDVKSADQAKNLSNVIKINESQIKDHLGQMVRSTVEETLLSFGKLNKRTVFCR